MSLPAPLNVFTLACVLLISGCSAISSTSDQEAAPIAANLAQCIAVQSSQAQNLSQLSAQIVELNSSMSSISELLNQSNNSAEQMTLSCTAVDLEPSKLIVGRQEVVWLQDLQLALPARVDTGAETASIDARNIESFERDGNTWVRFNILHPETGAPLQLERIMKRRVSIIQSNSIEAESRPVIELGITIGSIKQTAEFTLSDRSHLNHQILIGRNILRDVMIVDVSQSNIAPYPTPELVQNEDIKGSL